MKHAIQDDEIIKQLDKWEREAKACDSLAISAPRGAPSNSVTVELRTQFQTAARTYRTCIKDVKRLFELQ